MSKKKKIFIGFVILGIVLIGVGLFLIFIQKKEESPEVPPKQVEEPTMKQEHESYDKFVMDNFEIKGDFEYVIEFDVTNKNNRDYKDAYLILTFLRDDGSTIYFVDISIGDIKNGETKHIEYKTFYDFTTAADYTFYIEE